MNGTGSGSPRERAKRTGESKSLWTPPGLDVLICSAAAREYIRVRITKAWELRAGLGNPYPSPFLTLLTRLSRTIILYRLHRLHWLVSRNTIHQVFSGRAIRSHGSRQGRAANTPI
jgi:hypothetical protein